MTLEDLRKEIDELKVRNSRVEVDKAWEASLARKVLIVILTYGVIVVFFLITQLPHPFINALVPSLAFILSSLALPIAKRWWISKRNS